MDRICSLKTLLCITVRDSHSNTKHQQTWTKTSQSLNTNNMKPEEESSHHKPPQDKNFWFSLWTAHYILKNSLEHIQEEMSSFKDSPSDEIFCNNLINFH